MKQKGHRDRGLQIRRILPFIIVVLVVLSLSGTVAGNRSGMSFNELKKPPERPPLPPGQFDQKYYVGFSGLRFNEDNQNTLELDLGSAQTIGAEVTVLSDRVEVFQHSSPSVLITFRGDHFEYKNGKLVGTVTRADFVTSPLEGNISAGDVTAALRVDLLGLSGPAELTNLLDANLTTGVHGMIQNATATMSRDLNGVAFTVNITKNRLERTGAANLSVTVPSSWVTGNGGPEHVRFVRISDKDQTVTFPDTRYLGMTSDGAMKFEAYSPNGTSVFGFITTKALSQKNIDPPQGQIATDVGMMVWLSRMAVDNIFYLLVIGSAAIGSFTYLGWKKQKNLK